MRGTVAASIAALSVPVTLTGAARPCLETLTPFQWIVSEWTYDAPDPTGRGRASIDSIVGLYLTAGGTDYSCFGSWPDAWDGWGNEGRSLIWFSCVVNRGRILDTTVSFAMDWKSATLYAAHTFVCGDGAKQG